MSGGASFAHVVCFGNPWHGDDGFGQHVFRRLHERGGLPCGVAAFDGGTAGLDALPYFEGCAKAVIVDAVRTGGRIGTVHRLVPSDLEPPGGELSLHDLGVSDLLAALAVLRHDVPEVVLIGAEVSEIRTFNDRLSGPLEAAVPTAVRQALLECEIDERQLRWVGEMGVHNVNRSSVRALRLTFGTQTVRNVNTPSPSRGLLTKRTPGRSRSVNARSASIAYSRAKAAMISRSNSITCSCMSARARAGSWSRIASSSFAWSKTAAPRPGTRSSTTYQTRSESTK